MLTIRLFGKFRIQQNHREVADLSASKVQELFCYLLLHRRRPHNRETLAGILWGESSTAQSKKYLRQALWQLQTALSQPPEPEPHQILHLDPDWIQIDPQAKLWVDTDAFEASYEAVKGMAGDTLDAGAVRVLRQATDLYLDELLVGCYYEWCEFERARYQQMYLAMLDKLLDHTQSQGHYELGIDYGLRALRCDRARERTHQRLMALYALAGDRSAALRQFDQCAAALEEELGVSPSAETYSLYHAVRDAGPEGRPAPPPSRARDSQPSDIMCRLKNLSIALSLLQDELQAEIQMVERMLSQQCND